MPGIHMYVNVRFSPCSRLVIHHSFTVLLSIASVRLNEPELARLLFRRLSITVTVLPTISLDSLKLS